MTYIVSSALFLTLGVGVGCPAQEDCATAGQNAADGGCCEGLQADFSNTCHPCVPLGEARGVDGPGCCEGLVAEESDSGDLICRDPSDRCEAPDDSTRVALSLDIGDYPTDGTDIYRLDDVACAVAALDTSDPALVRTELSCDAPAGTTHTVVIEHASSDLGEPSWTVDEQMRLAVDYTIIPEFNAIPFFAVSLRALDGSLRLFAVDSDELMESVAAPLELSLDPSACGTDESHDAAPDRGLLSLTLEGASVAVSDSNDATLMAPEGTYAVELESALTGDFGERGLLFVLLVMQVQ